MSGKYALIIANTEYTDPGLAQLSAPGKDAKEFGRVLDSTEICAFDDVIVLVNENASKIGEAIDYFLSNRKPDDLLVLYFSGHGVRDEYGSLYLAVTNTNRARLRSTAIKSDFIRDAMDQSRSKRQVLILDCCNSGAFAQGAKAETGGSIGTASAFEGKGYGRVVLTASDSTQFAWEGDRVIGETENSLFTHFIVKGLEGAADTDGDGRITIDELYDYTYEQIVNITPKQTPGKWSYKQQGEILLRQNIRIEDTKPVPLPDDLVTAMNNSLPYIREGAVSQLELLLRGKNLSLARSARLALERIAAEDDSRRVVQAATTVLESMAKGDQLAASSRTGQLRRENTKQAEQFKAEQEKLLREKSELEKKLQEEHIARENERIEIQRRVDEEAQRLAAQKAVEERSRRDHVEPQPAPAKSRWLPIGIWGVVLLAIGLGGYAIMKALPPLVPNSTEAPIASPEATLPNAVVPLATPTLTPAPTEEAPTLTQAPTEEASTPTEDVTMTASAPQLQITDDKGASMVLVSAGDFPMGNGSGDPHERPMHTVNLTDYYIDKYEVTNALYSACVEAGVCNPPMHTGSYTRSSYYGNSQYGEYPVVYVNWNMAKAYCEWRGVRLPTEAQWEKAARGTDARIYPWGAGVDCQKANYEDNGNYCVGGTSQVGIYEAGKSPYGAYDMAGNVWEWVADWYSESYYQTSLTLNPLGPDFGQARVLRGGSWNRPEYTIRATTRQRYAPTYDNFDIGFRCAKVVR
jgi:formylglycine-generating enzyme required for sulfatase activity